MPDAAKFLLTIAWCALFFIWLLFDLYGPPMHPYARLLLRSLLLFVLIFGALFILLAIRQSQDPVAWRRLVHWLSAFGLAFLWALPLAPIVLGSHAGVPPDPGLAYYGFLVMLGAVWFAILVRIERLIARVLYSAASFIAAIAVPIVATIVQGYLVFHSLAVVEPAKPDVSCSGQPLFAHISDIHAVAPGRSRTFQGEKAGNAEIPKLLADIAALSPPYLLISGDITDTGSPNEWTFVRETIEPFAKSMKIILAPGNHDLSDFFSREFGGRQIEHFLKAQDFFFPEVQTARHAALHSAWTNEPSLNDQKFKDAASEIDTCTNACISSGKDPFDPLGVHSQSNFEPNSPGLRHSEPLQSQLAHRASCDVWCRNVHASATEVFDSYVNYWYRFLQTAFPLQWIDHDNGIAIFALRFQPIKKDVAERAQVGTNAIWVLDQPEATRLMELIEALPRSITTIVIMDHYPIARGPGEAMSPPSLHWNQTWGEWWDVVLGSEWWAYSSLVSHRGSAASVLQSLQKMVEKDTDRRFFWVFGHRHLRSFGKTGRVTLVEAPNVASQDAGFYLGTRLPTGTATISWCRRSALSTTLPP